MEPSNVNGPAKPASKLTVKQDLIFRLFSTIVSKQDLGKVQAAQVEQIMAISAAAAERILKEHG
jgi:hypothetical protein